jgi:hypothetical protein
MTVLRRLTDAVRSYVEREAHEQVVQLAKPASELVGPVRHDSWDVYCNDSRWWVITGAHEPVQPGTWGWDLLIQPETVRYHDYRL